MKRATYYYNVKERPDKYADLRKEIARIFEKNKGRYGYRRVYQQLRSEGIDINHKTVAKLMVEMGIPATTFGRHRHQPQDSSQTDGRNGLVCPET